MKRITQEEHEQKILTKFGTKIKLISYASSKNKNMYCCNIHGEFLNKGWLMFKSGSYGCPKCGDVASALAKTVKGKERRSKNLLDKFPHVHFAEPYKGSLSITKFICDTHGPFSTKPANLRNGTFGCPECAKENKSTPNSVYSLKELKKAVKNIHGSKYKVLGLTFVGKNNNTTKVSVECPEHGIQECYPYLVMKGKICTKCNLISGATKRFKGTVQYKKEVKEVHGTEIKVVGEYIGARIHSLHKCRKCKHEWEVVPTSILKGVGCPICNMMGNGPTAKYRKVALGTRLVDVQGHEDLALIYLVDKKKIDPRKIFVSSDGCIPTIPYAMNNSKRKYYPDIFIPSRNKIIEVKGIWSLGFETGRRTLEETKFTYKKNCEKAKAVMQAGYSFELLCFHKKKIFKLPENWYDLKYKEMSKYVATELTR